MDKDESHDILTRQQTKQATIITPWAIITFYPDIPLRNVGRRYIHGLRVAHEGLLHHFAIDEHLVGSNGDGLSCGG